MPHNSFLECSKYIYQLYHFQRSNRHVACPQVSSCYPLLSAYLNLLPIFILPDKELFRCAAVRVRLSAVPQKCSLFRSAHFSQRLHDKAVFLMRFRDFVAQKLIFRFRTILTRSIYALNISFIFSVSCMVLMLSTKFTALA